MTTHPRNDPDFRKDWFARYRSWPTKQNTCKRPKPETKARVMRAISEHLVKHPRDIQSANRLRKLEAES